MVCNALSEIEHRDTSDTTHLQNQVIKFIFPSSNRPHRRLPSVAPGQLAIRFELEFGRNFCLGSDGKLVESVEHSTW